MGTQNEQTFNQSGNIYSEAQPFQKQGKIILNPLQDNISHPLNWQEFESPTITKVGENVQQWEEL